MAEADSRAILLSKEQIAPAFFDLSTRLLGAILQKYTTYGISMAVWGDFSDGSKSLQEFIWESNRGGRFLFLGSRQEALAALLKG
jgi:hypothetical protein